MLNPGHIVGDRYEIVSLIGRGGMAKVYKAKDTKLNRLVAIKILNDEYAHDAEFVNKFLVEARAAAMITNPNIVNVYDVGEDGDIQYIVMELVEGVTLKKYIDRKGRLTFEETCKIAIQMAMGLEAAHDNHIIHRDIKPQNIVISKAGVIKVADFGIAKASTGDTISSSVVGSVHYIAPEQARSGYSDEKSDIYSLGITMYEMITGTLPFDSDNNVSIAISHMEKPITPPSELVDSVPRGLEQIILKATQKKTIDRYADIHELIADLRYVYKNPNAIIDENVYDDYDSEFSGVDSTIFFDEKDVKKYNNRNRYSDIEEELSNEKEYNEVVDPKIKKIMNVLTIVGGAIVVLLLLFVIIKLGFSGKVDIDKEVPNLVGIKLDEAKHIAENGKFKINVIGYDKKAPKEDKDKIVSQDPSSGKKWSDGERIINVIIAGTDEIKLPDFSGRPEKEVIKQLADMGLEHETKEIYDDRIEKGNVVKTNPPAYTMVVKGRNIVIFLSKGAENIKMIDVIGWNKEEAIKELKNLGLVPTTDEVNGEKDKVISTSIEVGAKVNRGSGVILKIGNGKKEKEIPDIVGMKKEEAIKRLVKLGIRYTETEEDSSSQEAGVVIKTVPEAGEKLEEDKNLVIIISKSSNITVPDLVGLSKDTAVDILSSMGLKSQVIYVESDDLPKGYVVSQTVLAGNKVEKGAVIKLQVNNK